MISSLLVVCHANICRSPLAEALLRRRLPHVAVTSSGIQALVGRPAHVHACDVARERGLDLSAHRARYLSTLLCARAEVILVMEDVQRRFVEIRYPFTQGRVFCIGALNYSMPDIPDPHGGPRAAFVECIERLDRCVNTWAERFDAGG